MSNVRALIMRAPGTNCDRETAYAFQRAGAATEALHANRVLENPARLREFQILCIPGGFSHGDDLAAGRILGAQMRLRLSDALAEFKDAGKLILGICNGFQVLMNSGVLLEQVPGDDGHPRSSATLTWNDSGMYQDRWVRLRVDGGKCVFFQGIETMELPIAHAEGKFVPASEALLRQWEAAGQLALRYIGNPNGAVADVAGVCDTTGRVCGLMPHPERHIDRTHHPRWTRGEGRDPGDGLRVFENAVRYFR